MKNKIQVFAPASVANVFFGFDILGFSVPVFGDIVTLTKTSHETRISKIIGNEKIPYELEKNTAGVAILSFLEKNRLDHGISIEIHKGIPLSSGLGGSAASAVAAVLAVNQFLEKPLSKEELIPYALEGEKIASGSIHGDNIAASMFGGVTAYLTNGDEYEILKFPLPDLYTVLIHPHIEIKTKQAREIISDTIQLQDYVKQNMALIRFISTLYDNDISKTNLEDRIIEPQRSHLIPGFNKLKSIALSNNALGFSISGAGPSCFAIFQHESEIKRFIDELQDLKSELPYDFDLWDFQLNSEGSKILEEE